MTITTSFSKAAEVTAEQFVTPNLSFMTIQFEDTPAGRIQEFKSRLLTATESGVDYFNVHETAKIQNGTPVIAKSENWLWETSEEWKNKIIAETDAIETDFFPGWFSEVSSIAFILIQGRLPEGFEIHPGGWLTCYNVNTVMYNQALGIFEDAQSKSESYDEMIPKMAAVLKASNL